MAQLTRHPSFEALKSDVPPARVPAAERAQAHAAFKDFIDLLQRARAQGQKSRTPDER